MKQHLDYISGSRKEPIGQLVADVPEKILNAFIRSEHPQTTAFLLTKMNPDQAAVAVQTMDEDVQTDILIRISELNMVKADVVDEVREVIRATLSSDNSGDEEVSGPKAAAEILNYVERTNEERIVSEIGS